MRWVVLGKYRTFIGAMAFLVAIVAKEFWFFGTTGGEVPSLLAAATSDGSKVFGCQRFRTLTRIVTLRSVVSDPSNNQTNVDTKASCSYGGTLVPAISTTLFFGTVAAHMSFLPITVK